MGSRVCVAPLERGGIFLGGRAFYNISSLGDEESVEKNLVKKTRSPTPYLVAAPPRIEARIRKVTRVGGRLFLVSLHQRYRALRLAMDRHHGWWSLKLRRFGHIQLLS